MFDFVWAFIMVICGGAAMVLHAHKHALRDGVATLFWVVLGVFIVRAFFWEIYTTHGPSMSPTLQNNTIVLVDKKSYGMTFPLVDWVWQTTFPKRNEVVAFHHHSNMWIKRIKAVPGDEVTFRPQDGWFVNKQWVSPPFRSPPDIFGYSKQLQGRERHQMLRDWDEKHVFNAIVPSGHVFVLGDNAAHSTDSRAIGFVKMKHIVGQVHWRQQ